MNGLVRLRRLVTNVVTKSDGKSSRFLGLEHLESGSGRLSVDPLPSKEAPDALVYEADDVLFGKLRPYLAKSYLATQHGTCTSELLVMRAGPAIDPRFLHYLTLSAPFLGWAATTSYGSQMPRTSWEAMSDFATWLPEVDEQRRVAAFLDVETTRIDRLSELRGSTAELVKAWRQSALSELFSTQGWQQEKLKHLLVRGICYGVLVPNFVPSDGVPLIRVSDLDDLRHRAVELVQIDRAQSNEYRRTVVEVGDLLVTVVGATAGKAALVPEVARGFNISRAVARVRLATGVDPYLVWTWTLAPHFLEQVALT